MVLTLFEYVDTIRTISFYGSDDISW